MAEPTASNDFDGILPAVGTFTVTPPGTGAIAVNVYGVEDIKLPDREVKKDTFTLVSGTRAGKEQALLGSEKVSTIEAKLCFHTGNFEALDAVKGKNGCAIALTITHSATQPGIVLTCKGGIEKLAFDRWQDSQHAVYSVTLSVDAGWTAAADPLPA